LKKLVEVGPSKTGKANIDQSLVIDTILTAIASNLVQNTNGAITVEQFLMIYSDMEGADSVKRRITECKMVDDS
jgi:hypothetical protein